MKILMVCLGNICRSPLAEGIMKTKIQEAGLDWKVDSAGTGSWHVGKLPDSRSIDVAKKHDLDITDQRAKQFQSYDLDNYDLVFAMDASNYQDINRLAKNDSQKNKVHLIMNMASPGMNQGVPDPYWGDDGFENVYQMLDLACDKVIEKYASH
ncbi:MAG: protein-tyrosine phosphatase [Maribacter sp.]|jgi:protein-tyrosine phosphatase